MKIRATMSRLLAVLILAILVANLAFAPVGAHSTLASASAGTGGAKSVSFTLDNVSVEVAGPFLPSQSAGIAGAGNASQVASFTGRHPFEELSVLAVPFGTKPGTEILPVAGPGRAEDYYRTLRDFRKS